MRATVYVSLCILYLLYIHSFSLFEACILVCLFSSSLIHPHTHTYTSFSSSLRSRYRYFIHSQKCVIQFIWEKLSSMCVYVPMRSSIHMYTYLVYSKSEHNTYACMHACTQAHTHSLTHSVTHTYAT